MYIKKCRMCKGRVATVDRWLEIVSSIPMKQYAAGFADSWGVGVGGGGGGGVSEEATLYPLFASKQSGFTRDSRIKITS